MIRVNLLSNVIKNINNTNTDNFPFAIADVLPV